MNTNLNWEYKKIEEKSKVKNLIPILTTIPLTANGNLAVVVDTPRFLCNDT